MRHSAAIILVLFGVVACTPEQPEDQDENTIQDQFADEPMNDPSQWRAAPSAHSGGVHPFWFYHLMNSHQTRAPVRLAYLPGINARNYSLPIPTPRNFSPPSPPAARTTIAVQSIGSTRAGFGSTGSTRGGSVSS